MKPDRHSEMIITQDFPLQNKENKLKLGPTF
jgi:hypothetical protein